MASDKSAEMGEKDKIKNYLKKRLEVCEKNTHRLRKNIGS